MDPVTYLGIAVLAWIGVLAAVFLGTLGALRTFFAETTPTEDDDP